MIVKCEQCQTRFKIPDEKVTDKGVKVRCTKCSHTFRVTRESEASASVGTPAPVAFRPSPGPGPSGFDPFEGFKTAPEPPKAPATRPTTPPLPAAPPPPAPWNSADSGVEEDAFHEATRVMPVQVPTEARPPVPSLPPLPFDFAPPATTPAPGQGLAGPRGPSFRPSSEPSAPIPGVPSVAPAVSPVGARGLPTPSPVKPGATKPGAAPVGTRPLAPSSPPAAGPAHAPRPGGKALEPVPAPASAPPAADLFTEFFAGPPGAAASAALPELPPAGMSEVPPVAASARSPGAGPSYGHSNADPFGSVDAELGEPPPDLGSAPAFDPTAMFSDPVPVPAPPSVAPRAPAAMGRPTPLPVPTSSAPQMGRPLPVPPASAPIGRLAPASSAPAPGPRLAPSPMFSQAAAPAPAAPVPSLVDQDPFGPSNADLSEAPADFGFAPDPASTPAYAEPAPAYAEPAPVAAPASFSFADEDPFGNAGADFGGAHDEAAAPAPAAYEAPAPMPAAPGMDEFGPSFGGGMPQEQAGSAAPAPAFAPPGPMDFGMIGDDQMPPEEGQMAAPGGMADPFAAPQPEGGGMADPFAAPQPSGGMADPFAAAAQGGMADPFAAPQAAGGIPDPFAAAEHGFSPTATGRQMIGASEGFLTQTDTSHRVIGPTDTGRHMLDLPSHEAAEPAPGEDPSAPVSRELIDLPSQPPESSAPRPVPTLAAPSISKPAGRPADMGIPEKRKPTTAQQVTGQMAYLTIAAGLLLAITAVGGVYVKKGRVDSTALSPASLMTLLTPSQFVASGITNGLYETRGGNPVFYVRGVVENRSSKPVRLKVNAALYDGGRRVKSQEGLAGLMPGPEDLHAITSAEAAAQLRTRLDAGATVIAPGGRAPFTIVFQEYPQELGAFRLEVTAEAVPEEGNKP